MKTDKQSYIDRLEVQISIIDRLLRGETLDIIKCSRCESYAESEDYDLQHCGMCGSAVCIECSHIYCNTLSCGDSCDERIIQSNQSHNGPYHKELQNSY